MLLFAAAAAVLLLFFEASSGFAVGGGVVFGQKFGRNVGCGAEACVLVGSASSSTDLPMKDSMQELEELAGAASLRVVGRTVCSSLEEVEHIRDALFDAASFVEEDEKLACVLDCELSPEKRRDLSRALQLNVAEDRHPSKKFRAMERQAREQSFGYDKFGEKRKARRASRKFPVVRVVDRTALVLELFGKRARSREGRLQVALAVALYKEPEIGETLGSTREERRKTMRKDRKYWSARAARLRKDIDAIGNHRERNRKKRRRLFPTVALVGYANAGKSSLLRALTGDDVFVDEKPFATIDPLARRLYLGDGITVLVTDTVGFVSNLPAQLTAAFRSTLEEVNDADVVVHVVDASAPSHLVRDRAKIVQRELDAIGVTSKVPKLTFFNKIDLVPSVNTPKFKGLVAGSARSGIGLDAFKDELRRLLAPYNSSNDTSHPPSRTDKTLAAAATAAHDDDDATTSQ